MNDNDLNEMIKKAQSMIQNNQIPDDIKALINNLQNSNDNSTNINNTYNNNYNNNYNNTNYNNNKYKNNNYTNGINTNNSYNYSSNTQEKNDIKNNNYSFSTSNENNNSNYNLNNSNIDMETLMKIQKIMSKMKNSSDDDMSKLLLSLKPYLRNGKKEKIDEYIQLIKMGKMTQLLDLFGGEKK